MKIVFPFDVPSLRAASQLINDVGPYIDLPKVGLEVFYNEGFPNVAEFFKKSGKTIFADAKLNDIPNTVKRAAKAISKHSNVAYFNVMASGGRPMMEAAMEGADEAARELGIERPKVIAVTVLTSLKFDHLIELGIIPKSVYSLRVLSLEDCNRALSFDGKERAEFLARMSERDKQEAITEIVMRWAETSVRAGIDCLLSSPLEIAAMNSKWPSKELFCPGIRMPWSEPDDQGRTASPGEAAKAGASAIVVGRPIREPAGGRTRQDIINAIKADIEQATAQ